MVNSENNGLDRRTLLGTAAVALAGAVAPAQIAYAGERSTRRPVDAQTVDLLASRLDDDLIRLRRSIHRHPEIAGRERRTAALVARRLRSAGLDVTTGVGGHGVVGILDSGRPGRTVAYRADMDAVPPEDQIGGDTRTAHVCGHDVHTTVGVGVAQVLADLRDRLTGRVVFVFQPAEETLAGAAAMLADGVFDRVRPSEIHALHCGPLPVGTFGVMPGYGMPGQDHGTVTLTGPDASAQARQLAAEIGGLGTVVPPETAEDLEQFVKNLQTPGGPLAEFVFMNAAPSDAVVELAYRCWPEERYVSVRDDIRRLAQAYDGASAHFPEDPFPAMICPEREGRAVERYLRRAVGRDRTIRLHASTPFNGEDFALFLDRMPGTYSYLGVRSPGAPLESASPHFVAFDPDERAIGYGVRAMAGWLARRARSAHPAG